MPEKKTQQRAKRAKAEGKAPSTQAGEFVREEIEHVREGKHGAKNPKQAIAIGLSKARRAGVKVGGPKKKSRTSSKRKSTPKRTTTSKGTRRSPTPRRGGARRARTSAKRSRSGARKSSPR